MKIFFDLRLGYLVNFPGSDSPTTGLQGKAGDDEEIQIQFGRSSNPIAATSLIDSPTWTPETLIGGTVITAGIKRADEYSDGELLSGNSTWILDAVNHIYSGRLDLNTVEINDALNRGDATPSDDLPLLDCGFEVTFQPGGTGGWRSSVLPVDFLLYHDLIAGSEDTPVSAADPTQYLLKDSAIEWLPTITSKIGGTSIDLDSVPTVGVDPGKAVQFVDQDGAIDLLRRYRLAAGATPESSPTVIRPDDYDAVTNAKVWELLEVQEGLTAIQDDLAPALGGDLDTNEFNVKLDNGKGILDENGNAQLITETTAAAVNYTAIKNAATGNAPAIRAKGSDTNIGLTIGAKGTGAIALESPLAASKIVKTARGADVASAAALTVGDDGNYFVITGTTAITSIATKGVGTTIKARFAGILTLTHHVSNLTLPGAASITTAAGDEAEFIEYASGQWRCVKYQRASGKAVVQTGGVNTFYVGAKEMNPSATNGAVLSTFETATQKRNFDVLEYNTTTKRTAEFIRTMPSNWDLGPITAKIHWTASSGSGIMRWAFQGTSLPEAGSLDAAIGTPTGVYDTLTTALYMHVTDSTPDTTIGGTKAAGTPVSFRIGSASSGITLSADAKLIGVEITFGTI